MLIFSLLIVSTTAEITPFYFLFNKSIHNENEKNGSIYVTNITLEVADEITLNTKTRLNAEITYVKPLIFLFFLMTLTDAEK